MMSDNKKEEENALKYHEMGRPGKTEIVPTKPFCTPEELALAYSPGVAAPAIGISRDKWNAYKYTNKGNLVAVISNGSSVLGLGNTGALASKPVMEGKSMLFKIYGDIDAFDIEIAENDPEKLIEIIHSMAPTFGGINLEDIKSPNCFHIEQRLRELLDIPVMHDDQQGTAVTVGAALINAAEIAGKELHSLNIVINGAGAAAIATARMLIKIGIQYDHILMFDSHGIITTLRRTLTPEKREFATSRRDIDTLSKATIGADVFLGLSKGNTIDEKELIGMARNPIIFALANPIPEINYGAAIDIRPDAIVATGRTDTPNQINNVLAFPYLFRGALDTRATEINDNMLVAAVKAIAELAHRPVPNILQKMYGKRLSFGKEYLLPKPNDRRLISLVSGAVARAAIDSGIARCKISDWDNYYNILYDRLEREHRFCREIFRRNKQNGTLHKRYIKPFPKM